MIWNQEQPATDTNNATLPGYRTAGNGPHTVLCLHDWLGSSANWSGLAATLDPAQFRLLAVDARGYGLSRDLGGDYTLDELTGDLLRLIAHLGVPHVHLVAHSMNGLAAVRILIEAPARIASLVLVTPVPPHGFQADPGTLDFMRNAIHDAQGTAGIFNVLTGERYHPSFLSRLARRNIESSTAEAMRGYFTMVTASRLTEQLAKCKPTTPTCLLAGNHDAPQFRAEASREAIGGILPAATIESLADTGHYPMFEAPPLFEAKVAGFIEQQAR